MQEVKRQFIRKIIRNGRQKHYWLSIGKILPKSWDYVLVRILEESPEKVIVEFRRVQRVKRNGEKKE